MHADRPLAERAFVHFLDARDARVGLEWTPFPFSFCELAGKGAWPLLGGFSVEDELRESINLLNAWQGRRFDWDAWQTVLGALDEQDAWTIRSTFVEPIAHFCMLQPSSTRDRLGSIATTSVHQANLKTDLSYRDVLVQDNGRMLSRSNSEKQLRDLGARWKNFAPFKQSLESLDQTTYRTATRNFRNLSSHGIAPRFDFGETRFVKRGVVPFTDLVPNPDGTHRLVEHATRKSVRYAFGGTPALALHDMYRLNTEQYDLAVSTFVAYTNLITELLEAMASDIGAGNPGAP